MRYNNYFMQIINRNLPNAIANVSGSSDFPLISGKVKFYSTPLGGIIIEAEFVGLPSFTTNTPEFFGFHMHETGNCSNDFKHSGNHFNPMGTVHPNHAGDLPPLLAGNNYAYSLFYDDFLTIEQIIGKSVIIHYNRDDFTSQPNGDCGNKIACGVIKKYN